MSQTRRSLLLGAGGVAALVTRSRAQTPKVITFGGSIPMSGEQADTGLNVLAGYQTAVKYINEKQGGLKLGADTYTLALQMFDDASDPQRATTLIQKQLDSGVNFFLGSFSSPIVLPTAAITDRAKKPMVQAGGGADAIFTRGLRYVFGMFPRASRQLIPLVGMLRSIEPRPQRIAMITVNDTYSRSQADAAAEQLKASGFTITEVYRLPASVSDVAGVVSQIRAAPPDVIICNTRQRESLLITQQLVATDTNVKLLFEALGPEVASFRATLGKDAEGLTFLQYWDPRMKYTDPVFGTSTAYYDYYKSTTNRPSAYQTVAAAACIVSYCQAFQKAGLDPERVRDALAELDFTSIYGRIKFTPQGDGDPELMGSTVGQIHHGEGDIVYPPPVSTGKLVYPLPKWSERG